MLRCALMPMSGCRADRRDVDVDCGSHAPLPEFLALVTTTGVWEFYKAVVGALGK